MATHGTDESLAEQDTTEWARHVCRLFVFFSPIKQTDAEETLHRLFYESQSPLISDSHRGTTCFFLQTPRFGKCRRGCGSQKASRRKATACPVAADTGAGRGTPGKELGCQSRHALLHAAAARDAAAPPNSWRKRRRSRGVGGAWAPPRLGGLSERPRPLPTARARAPSSAARFLPRPSAAAAPLPSPSSGCSVHGAAGGPAERGDEHSPVSG